MATEADIYKKFLVKTGGDSQRAAELTAAYVEQKRGQPAATRPPPSTHAPRARVGVSDAAAVTRTAPPAIQKAEAPPPPPAPPPAPAPPPLAMRYTTYGGSPRAAEMAVDERAKQLAAWREKNPMTAWASNYPHQLAGRVRAVTDAVGAGASFLGDTYTQEVKPAFAAYGQEMAERQDEPGSPGSLARAFTGVVRKYAPTPKPADEPSRELSPQDTGALLEEVAAMPAPSSRAMASMTVPPTRAYGPEAPPPSNPTMKVYREKLKTVWAGVDGKAAPGEVDRMTDAEVRQHLAQPEVYAALRDQ